MELLSALLSGSGKARQLLTDYDDERFVHAGMPDPLSRDQRHENLAAFIESIERRIIRLQSFAAELETSLPTPDGDRIKVDRVAASLNAFCKTKIAGLKEVEPALSMDWRSRALGGIERRSHTLSIDLGTYCGEIAIRCAPQDGWVTDETRYTRRTVMETAGRMVIDHNPAVLPKTMTNHVDAHAIAAFALSQIVHYRKSKSLWRPDYLTFLCALADGLYA